VRILFIIETTPEMMTRIMNHHEDIGKLCRNDWVRLAVLDPSSSELSVFQGGAFRSYQPQSEVLPTAASSVDWYRGWRDHLEFAEIEGQATPSADSDRLAYAQGHEPEHPAARHPSGVMPPSARGGR
jgi:hypothetical protein